ncbi:MAG: hypothetical protein HFH14_04955 [Lachnospiraceae bacterium]|nr:hypothetical protein [Lachnospiraceae bacterium]
MNKRNIFVTVLCISAVLCGLCSTFTDAAAKNKSGYTKKSLKLDFEGKYGDYFSLAGGEDNTRMGHRISLDYNEKDRLCLLYLLNETDENGRIYHSHYVRSWPLKGKETDRVVKCKKRYDECPVRDYYDIVKINEDGMIFSAGWTWLNPDDVSRRRPGVKFKAVGRNGKVLSSFPPNEATSFFDAGATDGDGMRNEYYEIKDFEINGEYVDFIFERTDYNSEANETRYSLQRFKWKTGEIVRNCELPRPCQKLCGGYPYGTDDVSFYKYSKNGGKCLWEHAVPKEKTPANIRTLYPVKNDYRLEQKRAYDVVDGKIYFSNVNGVYMLDTKHNKSKPKKLITAKDCPKLKRAMSCVVDLVAVNENLFYIAIGEDMFLGDPEDVYLYQYSKR